MLKKHEAEGTAAGGVVYAAAAYTAWGFLPLYWKALKSVGAGEILAHRIIWSFVFVACILSFSGGWREVRLAISSRKKLLSVFLGGLLISGNWFIYIWAVNSDKVIEASLGYYINPLFIILLGVFVLRERLDRWQLLSLILAFIAVGVITIHYGRVPWVAILLAVSFGLYGLVKKLSSLSSMAGLALETVVMVPLALVYLYFRRSAGSAAFGLQSYEITLLLVFSGVVTATPLLWFAQGAKRIPLATVGFIQYLSPSISLLLGIFLFKESFSSVDFITFGFIWCALALYTFTRKDFMRSLQRRLTVKQM